MDAHHTYKGDRKKANRGVFKLLRLKSSRQLRKFRRKPAVRKQHCSRCHKVGHNSLNKLCAAEAAREITGDIAGEEVEGVGVGVADLLDENIVAGLSLDDTVDDSVVDPDDLLGDSDDDLY